MPADKEQFCFVLSPIGEPVSETRRRADGILEEIIEPALDGFHVKRADHENAPGILTEQIVNDVLDADLVVADLTDLNANVVYELAVRHAVGKPFVQMMEHGGELPFDVEAVNTVYFHGDLKGRAQAVENLKEAAEKALEEPDLGNPIRRAVQMRGLRPQKGSELEVLVDAVRGLQEQMTRLRRNRRQGESPGSSSVGKEISKLVREVDWFEDTSVEVQHCSVCRSRIEAGDEFAWKNDGSGWMAVCLQCAPSAGGQ